VNTENAILDSMQGLSTATAHEAAGKIGALPSAIKPIHPSMRLCGRAFPVKVPPGDNLFLHHAIYQAQPGEVLVVDTGGTPEFGYWGEVMALAAQIRDIAGLVISGGVRDSSRMIDMGFPVFAMTTCIRGTGKDPFGAGALMQPIRIGGTEVRHGDIVLGDNDGVMIMPLERAANIIAEARRRDAAEEQIFQRLHAGETTLQIYGLPDIGKNRA
jgi:4-hydroxy-4-methyl-2-oxoglutarate aldolase